MIARRLLVALAIVAVAATAWAESPAGPQYKYSTPIAPGVAVPDRIESSIGTLNLHYGYPEADRCRVFVLGAGKGFRPRGCCHGNDDERY